MKTRKDVTQGTEEVHHGIIANMTAKQLITAMPLIQEYTYGHYSVIHNFQSLLNFMVQLKNLYTERWQNNLRIYLNYFTLIIRFHCQFLSYF